MCVIQACGVNHVTFASIYVLLSRPAALADAVCALCEPRVSPSRGCQESSPELDTTNGSVARNGPPYTSYGLGYYRDICNSPRVYLENKDHTVE